VRIDHKYKSTGVVCILYKPKIIIYRDLYKRERHHQHGGEENKERKLFESNSEKSRWLASAYWEKMSDDLIRST